MLAAPTGGSIAARSEAFTYAHTNDSLHISTCELSTHTLGEIPSRIAFDAQHITFLLVYFSSVLERRNRHGTGAP